MNYEVEVIGNCTLYRGDCRDVFQSIDKVDALIADPVWPNNNVKEFQKIDPIALFHSFISSMQWYINPKRFAFIVNCDTDPSFMFYDVKMKFFRVMWLRYALPGHKGRLLNSANVAYLFGDPPKARKGNMCIGGECNALEITAPGFKSNRHGHPCPRRIEHMNYVVDKWSNPGEMVLDPFMGAGTTGVACVNTGRRFIGIEIERKYFDIACKRIEQAVKEDRFLEGKTKKVPRQQLMCENSGTGE